jgi:hypothetical protein
MSAFSRAPSSGETQNTGTPPDLVAARTTGAVVGIDDGIASVLVGPEREPWEFPLEILPETVAVDSVLILERLGRRLRFVELDPVAEVARGRPFDLRLRRTARKLPYMKSGDDPAIEVRRGR